MAVGDVPGLSMIVHPTGRKVFSLFYRAEGRPERLKIGEFPTISPAEAKKAARAALHALAVGGNPAAEKRRGKLTNTVSELGLAYIEHAKAMGRRSWPEKERILERYVFPSMGSYKLTELSRAELARLLDRVAKHNGPTMANRVLAEVRAMLNWALGRGEVEFNAAAHLPKPGQERARTRILSAREIGLLWKAAGHLNYPFGPFVRMLLLTGQRVGEVAGMRRSEIDERTSVWTIPAIRAKNGLEHEVPLTALALRVLESCPYLGDAVFTSGRRGDRPINCFSAIKIDIDSEIAKEAPLNHWVFHDLRRTFRTGLAELAIDPHIAERALNHIDGGVRRVYDRHNYRERKREALTRWSEYVESLLDPAESSVIDLNRVSMAGR